MLFFLYVVLLVKFGERVIDCTAVYLLFTFWIGSQIFQYVCRISSQWNCKWSVELSRIFNFFVVFLTFPLIFQPYFSLKKWMEFFFCSSGSKMLEIWLTLRRIDLFLNIFYIIGKYGSMYGIWAFRSDNLEIQPNLNSII